MINDKTKILWAGIVIMPAFWYNSTILGMFLHWGNQNMVEKIKQILGIGDAIARYDEIMAALYISVRKRNIIFHSILLAVAGLLLLGGLLSLPGFSGSQGSFMYEGIHIAMMVLTVAVMLAERWFTGQAADEHITYYRLEAVYVIAFMVWGIVIAICDQENGRAVFYFVLLAVAWISMLRPWLTLVLFAAGLLVLMLMQPAGADTNILYGIIAIAVASVLAVATWYLQMENKLDELIVAGRYAEMEKKNDALDAQAHQDTLTGLGNRYEYDRTIGDLMLNANGSVACIYIDANGLHELNNHLGHDAGDEMLRTVSRVILQYFTLEESFRIGGDEFVVLCQNAEEEFLRQRIMEIKKDIEEFKYSISAGLAHSNYATEIELVIQTAENRMREDKLAFYAGPGAERQKRELNEAMEKVVTKKRDTDRFLKVIEPIYKGVYFVDLDTDTARDVFMPPEFKSFLEKADNKFSVALQEFSRRMIRPAYFPRIQSLCNYEELRSKLEKDKVVKLTYDQMDGDTVRLRIYPVEKTLEEAECTLWIFDEDN